MIKTYNQDDYKTRNYEFSEIEEDPRFVVANKEFKIAYLVWALFTVTTIGIAYYFGKGDPTQYTYVMGLPKWFFLTLVNVVFFIGVISFIVKRIFKDMDLNN